jgi:cation-transporting ATPase 13A3/4/5
MMIMAYGENFSDLQFIVINYVGSLPYLKALSLSPPSDVLTT